MKNYNLPVGLTPLRTHCFTRTCCLLFVLLALCGKAQSSTTTFDPYAMFDSGNGSITEADYGLWVSEQTGKPVTKVFQIENESSHANEPATHSDSPSRLSFFYILGTAALIALLVEVFSKKDI